MELLAIFTTTTTTTTTRRSYEWSFQLTFPVQNILLVSYLSHANYGCTRYWYFLTLPQQFISRNCAATLYHITFCNSSCWRFSVQLAVFIVTIKCKGQMERLTQQQISHKLHGDNKDFNVKLLIIIIINSCYPLWDIGRQQNVAILSYLWTSS
jgi:hypothetical protein